LPILALFTKYSQQVLRNHPRPPPSLIATWTSSQAQSLSGTFHRLQILSLNYPTTISSLSYRNNSLSATIPSVSASLVSTTPVSTPSLSPIIPFPFPTHHLRLAIAALVLRALILTPDRLADYPQASPIKMTPHSNEKLAMTIWTLNNLTSLFTPVRPYRHRPQIFFKFILTCIISLHRLGFWELDFLEKVFFAAKVRYSVTGGYKIRVFKLSPCSPFLTPRLG
jgi:hypothetical protein